MSFKKLLVKKSKQIFFYSWSNPISDNILTADYFEIKKEIESLIETEIEILLNTP